MGKEVDDIVFWLFDKIKPVKIEEDEYKDLPPEAIESIFCALMNLSSAVANCLATVIKCVSDVKHGTQFPLSCIDPGEASSTVLVATPVLKMQKSVLKMLFPITLFREYSWSRLC